MTARPPTGKPFAKGVDARRNTRVGGRPPDAWKQQLAQLVTRDATLTHVRTVLDAGPDHPAFFRALSYATDYGIGRPTQPVDLGIATGPITVITGVPESGFSTPAHFLPAPPHLQPTNMTTLAGSHHIHGAY